MGEVERRRGYGYNRVLIESARILDPEFNDAVVFLTGAQVELLRNVTQYLNRLDTYAAKYETGYYLVPTEEDFDDILEVVADLEETLMGNPNTIWGYKERWFEPQVEEGIGVGYTYCDMDPVPAGFVYVLEHWTIVHTAGGALGVLLSIVTGGHEPVLYIAPNLPSGDHVYETTRLTLEEGDYLAFRLNGLPVETHAYMYLWGYKMAVPVE